MKHTSYSIFVLLFSINIINLKAQTSPDSINLIHQWTFDDGTANDCILSNPINGELEGGATISNKALQFTSQGQYLSFVGTSMALNTYSAISQEIWITPSAGANAGYTMLSYFGNSSAGMGYNYISLSAARGDDVSRTAISNGTYNSEVGANGTEYDDGKLHQMVSVISSDSVILYIDGKLASKTKNTIPLSTISKSLAYLGKGGYTADPTWIGSISKYSIYNKSLTAGEVKFLFQQGAEQSPMISASKTKLSFDEYFRSETITVSGTNLSDSIVISAPTGITINPTKLAPNITNASVSVFYSVSTTVDGNIGFSSGDATLDIPVKSYSNDCFSSVYPDVTNLIPNPYISSLEYFSGWGNRSINTDKTYAYCGATSGMVSGSDAGSLDVTLTGKLLKNTYYRVKAKVYTIGGSFQIGIIGWSNNQSDYTKSITKTDSWQDVDFTFATGSVLGSTQSIFFNNYGLSGTTGYIDNWEMYAIPKIYTSKASIEFPTLGSKKIAVKAVSLTNEITITSPVGFTVIPAVLPYNINGDSITITFDYETSTQGYIYFTSGNFHDSLFVSGNLAPTIVTSASLISLDEINNTTNFTITGYNLTNNVAIDAPAGITINPTTLSQNISQTLVTVTYDGISNSSGIITFTSSTAKTDVSVLANRNEECFIPLYQDKTNLIIDPTCNSYTNGSGNISINADPDFVYCGSRSGKVNGNGSFKRDLTGLMKPNTTYHTKAMVYKTSPVDGQNMGKVTYTLDIDSSSFPEPYRLIKIAMDSACSYYNKYTPFIYDIYVYYNAGIPTAQASYHGSIGFGPNTRYMWVGTAIHEMAHYFGSGTSDAWHSLMVNGLWKGAVANKLMLSINGGKIYGDSQHFWPYGINQKEEITGLGSLAVQDKALADAVRLVKAMLVDDCKLPTNNPPVGIGVYGWDSSSDDIYHEVDVPNSWQVIDFTFTTGNTLKGKQSIYFSEGSGYIDNWELYEIPVISVEEQKESIEFMAYFQENNIVVEFEMMDCALINISVYDIQGKLVHQTNKLCEMGKNKTVIATTLSQGMYLVKITNGGYSNSLKVVNW